MLIKNKIARITQLGLVLFFGFLMVRFFYSILEESPINIFLKGSFSIMCLFLVMLLENYLTHPHEEIEYNTWSLAKKKS